MNPPELVCECKGNTKILISKKNDEKNRFFAKKFFRMAAAVKKKSRASEVFDSKRAPLRNLSNKTHYRSVFCYNLPISSTNLKLLT